VAGETLRGFCSCVVVVTIHSWLWLIEAWRVVYSFIERWKREKAHKPRLQCFVLRIQQSVNQGCVAFEGI